MQYVAYFRVSTQKQGRSGLGLEAQRVAVAHYNPIAEFVEIESGKNDDRARLHEAMKFASTNNAALVVAKLDRLSRNAAFLLSLMERGVRIRCADMPDADEFQLHLYAILAHKERKMISERTKAALAAAKARGVKLGGAQKSTQDRVDAFTQSILPVLRTLIDSGIDTPAAIAMALNERAVRTSRGAQWGAGQVVRLLNRLGMEAR
ncbi:resolvase [Rhizobium altiplani]|uniref:Resolvase n=1 Tax=Rhizobium altiplani TaxID=1864509 RepID=A0A120FG64_9HYPH|nr:recombinase family protein [Rhizobium altiplani]KWV43896.1 resolvase [Rhizobium altiplani]